MCSTFNGKILPYLWDTEKDMGILMLLLEKASLNMGSLMPAPELERDIFPDLKFHTNASPELMDVKNTTFESGELSYGVCARILQFLQASHSYTSTSLWKQREQSTEPFDFTSERKQSQLEKNSKYFTPRKDACSMNISN
uniref:Uncharacterized protein n=1 Tax=Micrurus corallinus TaxID=54390 RepID=A0A2D4FWN2_MICCO